MPQTFLAGPWLYQFVRDLHLWQNSEQATALLSSRPLAQTWNIDVPPEGQRIAAGERILAIEGPSYLVGLCARPILRMTSKLAGIAAYMSQLWDLPFGFVDVASEAEHPVDAAWCARAAWLAGCTASTLGGPGEVPGLEICDPPEEQRGVALPFLGSIGTFLPVPAGDLGSALHALTHLPRPPHGLWLGDQRDWRDVAVFRRALDRRGWGTTRLLFLGPWVQEDLPAMRASRAPIDLMGTSRTWPMGPRARHLFTSPSADLNPDRKHSNETPDQIKERLRAGYRG